jgi:hypothetical protein
VLPRDEAYGLKSFPTIGTKLAAIGPWRATVTEYDFEYAEHVQAGGGAGGGHVSGGALSLLYHQSLGPILTASMTAYQMIEISNMQQFRDGPHMALTPRIECVGGETYTNLNDLKSVLTASETGGEIVFEARGQLMTASRQPPPSGDLRYHTVYRAVQRRRGHPCASSCQSLRAAWIASTQSALSRCGSFAQKGR